MARGSVNRRDFFQAWIDTYGGFFAVEDALAAGGYADVSEMFAQQARPRVLSVFISANGDMKAKVPTASGFDYISEEKMFTPDQVLGEAACAMIPAAMKAGPRPLIEVLDAQAPVMPQTSDVRALLRYMEALEAHAKTCRGVVNFFAADEDAGLVAGILQTGQKAQAASREAAKDIPLTIKIDDHQTSDERHPDAPVSLDLELKIEDNLVSLRYPNPQEPALPSSVTIELENGVIAARGYNANSEAPMKLTVPLFPHSTADVAVDEMDYEDGRYPADEMDGPC